MTALLKARLAEITAGDAPAEVPGTSVAVQFNPTSLRVQIANKTAGGQQSGAQARQRPGTGEMQVSFDLVFDTADDGSDVLERTRMVERFVRPQGTQPGKEAPPRVLFQWGSFLVQGTMESANLDLDLFDASGIPLRAKVSVAIKGQDPRWTYQPAPAAPAAGPGKGAGTQPPAGGTGGLPAGAPGTQGSRQAPDRVVQAMPGESLQQLAARHGLDPSAWRALADGRGNPLSLRLGQEVALPVGLGAGSASGRQAQGQDPARSTAGLPLVNPGDAPPSLAPSAWGASSRQPTSRPAIALGDTVRQGQAVAGRGGLAMAIRDTKAQAHQRGARQSLGAFGVPAAETADTQDRPWGAGVPLRPRLGGGAARNPEPLPTRMALNSPTRSTAAASAQGSSSSARARGASPASRGCGCRGRRARPTR